MNHPKQSHKIIFHNALETLVEFGQDLIWSWRLVLFHLHEIVIHLLLGEARY